MKRLALALAVLLAVGACDTGGEEEPPADALTLVAGRVDRLALEPAVLAPVRLPVRVTALEAGKASARISPVVVDGERTTLEWDGGRPFTITGKGRLRLSPVTAEAQPLGLTLALDGATARLPAGSYRLGGGLTGRFRAVKATRLTFSGAATLALPRRALTVSGPGRVVLAGDVELTTDQRDRRARAFSYGPGDYRLDLVWVGRHLEVDAVLDGAVTTAGD